MRGVRGLIIDHEFYCCKCGERNKITIPRKSGQEREKGHLKKLWCPNCNETVNHVECVPYSKYDFENFLEEYLGGNFTEEYTRKKPYGLFKDEMIHNKQWDELGKKVIAYMLEGDDRD